MSTDRAWSVLARFQSAVATKRGKLSQTIRTPSRTTRVGDAIIDVMDFLLE
jgi:hypothetical protein